MRKPYKKRTKTLLSISFSFGLVVISLILPCLQVWQCCRLVRDGKDTTAVVVERGDILLAARKYDRKRPYTDLEYSGYRVRVQQFLQGSEVPVVYLPSHPTTVLVGGRGDGVYSLWRDNYNVFSTTFVAILAVVSLGTGIYTLCHAVWRLLTVHGRE